MMSNLLGRNDRRFIQDEMRKLRKSIDDLTEELYKITSLIECDEE